MGIKDSKVPKTDDKLDSVAIIMDGNGRWALSRGLPREAGHAEGVRAVERAISAFFGADIHYLTLYAFSTENWKRPEREVEALMSLLFDNLDEKLIKRMKKEGFSVRFIGDISALPEKLNQRCREIENTACGASYHLNIALNYGGKEEILNAARKVALSDGESFTEEIFRKHLYTHHTPDPDLIIRTGGDIRISNFLLWQCAYSEFLFIDRLWPDFGEEDAYMCINEFYKRHRRFGGLDAMS